MLAELPFGRLAVVVGRLLVPAVGRLLAVGLEVVVGRVVAPVLLGRVEALPADMLPDAVGRVVVVVPLIEPVLVRPDTVAPLIEPVLVRPETVAPLCVLCLPPLIEPALLFPCLTLAT